MLPIRNLRQDAQATLRHPEAMLGTAQIRRELQPAVLAKCNAFLAGRQAYIPTRPERLLKIVPTLSLDEAQAVCDLADHAVERRIYFKNDRIQARHSRARVLKANGIRIADIAAELGLTESAVRHILKGST